MHDSSRPPQSPQSTLGYLAAFTLGIICMGAIIFFTRAGKTPQTDASLDAEAPSSPGPQRIHFQRTNPPAGLRESFQRRAIARPLPQAQRSSTDIAASDEIPAAENAPLVEQVPFEEPAHFVPPPAAVVAVPVAAVPDALPNGARISGRAFLMFKPPAEMQLPLDANCAREFRAAGLPPTTRHFVVGRDNGLANVFVMVTAGLPNREWPVPQRPATLRLRGCLYENPIVGVQTGQRLLVSNNDRVLHNIHNTPDQNREQNKAMLPRSAPLEFVFENPELFMRFKCDVHPWEFAYVSVLEHPFFAVTDANGNFAIDDLPPGRYTIEAHHRKAGILRREITVEEFRNASADFHFREA